MTLVPLLFLGLLAIELALAAAAFSSRPRIAAASRVFVCLLPVTLMVGLRIARAFSTHAILDWDETYYTSLAVTGAAGHGLYPYIFGFGPMHAMGGMGGYVAYSFALAVKLFGPTVFALRGVSLFASVLGLAGIWTLVRSWYGSGTAWMAAALTSALQLFVLSNSARLDSWTFAYVAWALVVASAAFERWTQPRWHLLAGLMFGLGLEVHIDTIATAMACGILYLIRYLRDALAAGRPVLPKHPMFLYLTGVVAGLIVYVCLNILPDLAAYYATTVLVRIDATGSYSSGTSSIVGSFLNPHILIAKEAARYRQLLAVCHPLEIGLAAVAIAAMAVRRNAADRILLLLFPAVVLAAAVVLNNASPLYYIHVLPALVVPLAPLFTHGASGQARVPVAGLKPGPLLAFVIVCCGLCAVSGARTIRTIAATRGGPPPTEDVRQARALVDRRCRVAGDGGLYLPFFADYPYFISHRDTEVKLGMLYYRTTDEAAYWQIKQPDVVLATDPMRPGLSAYVSGNHLTQVRAGLWVKPGVCTGRP